MLILNSLYSQLLLFLLLTVFTSTAMSEKILSVNFEVYGKVQGVFFRKYTQQEAKKLGLKGFCLNTSHGTVKGTMEGDPNKVELMKNWLQKVGSPSSRIERAVFSQGEYVDKFTQNDFVIKR